MIEKTLTVQAQYIRGSMKDGQPVIIAHYDIGRVVAMDERRNHCEAVRSIFVVDGECVVNDTDLRLIEINGQFIRYAEAFALLEAVGVAEWELGAPWRDENGKVVVPLEACDA